MTFTLTMVNGVTPIVTQLKKLLLLLLSVNHSTALIQNWCQAPVGLSTVPNLWPLSGPLFHCVLCIFIMPNVSTITDNGDGTLVVTGDSEFLAWCEEFVTREGYERDLEYATELRNQMARDAYLYSL